MFFFGAFSGNLLYLILAISYLVGCSAMVFRGSDEPSKETITSETTSYQFLKANELVDSCCGYYLPNVDNHFDKYIRRVDEQPLIPSVLKIQFILPLLTHKSHFSGSALFTRPPPFFLV